MPYHFAAELARFGPGRQMAAISPRDAAAYCRKLMRGHYENFVVASCLLPKRLRQHFANVYAYCRWADDLADETTGGQETLKLLDWWAAELDRCYAGQPYHPVMVALITTIQRFAIPRGPFADLLVAFRQDQTRQRYLTQAELLEYCRYSANPVGRLVLYSFEAFNPENSALSDQICTGLQLVNCWQDVPRDYAKGRIYLPHDTWQQFNYTEAKFALCQRTNRADDDFRAMLAVEVERAENMLHAGEPLMKNVPRALRTDLRLFIDGGLATAEAIRRQQFDVWSRRPTVGKFAKLKLLLRARAKVRRMESTTP